MDKCRTLKCIVVLVPLPLQGHMTPMIQLGKILHSRGFSIVVAHSKLNPPNPLNHPEFIFQPLSDNLSGCDTSFTNLLNVILAMNNNCRAPFDEYMVRLVGDQKLHGYEVSCIIYDSLMNFVDSVATSLKIPSIVLRTSSATYMQSYHYILQLQAQNLLPFPESRLQEPVPELHPLRFKDLPFSITAEIPEVLTDFWASIINIRSSVAIIWNTTDYLEHPVLSQLQKCYKVPFFPIGPLHKMAAPTSTSFLEDDHSCISWLNKQASNSVLYISLGSIACVDKLELTETAYGLASSGIPFLWVVRSDSVNGSPSELFECFPEVFKALIGERGLIIKWAPQKEVLAHRAVGGFWSHCGWNSIIESICEGVPMICRPHFGDQIVNLRYLTSVWKVGLEMENVKDRGSIERAIRRLMVDREGKEMRQRTLDMKGQLEAGMQEAGSSFRSLNDLTEFISSFPDSQHGLQHGQVDVLQLN